jgi:DnaJ-domain-containing protein 1
VKSDPVLIRKLFYFTEFMMFSVIVAAIVYFTRKRDESKFKLREADRFKGQPMRTPEGRLKLLGKPTDPLRDAKMKRNEPLRLTGISISGSPEQILGLSPNPTEAQVQKAYRDLMKRYHPDLVGRPDSREWQDAQKIAEALNRAKDELLKKIQSQSPNRSGR